MELKRLAKEGWEALFRTLFEHSAEALFVLDSAGRIVELNRQASDTLVCRREDLIGKSPVEFDACWDQAFPHGFGARLGCAETVSFQTTHRRKNGTVFPADVRVVPVGHGAHRLALFFARDLSERASAEALQASEERFRTLVQLSFDVYWETDAEHRFTLQEFSRGWPTRPSGSPRSARSAGRCPTSSRTRTPGASTGRRWRRIFRSATLSWHAPPPRVGDATCRSPGSLSTTGAGTSWGIGVSGGTFRSSSAPRRSMGHTSGSWSPWIGSTAPCTQATISRGWRARCSRLPSRSSPATGHGSPALAIRKPQNGVPSWSARGRRVRRRSIWGLMSTWTPTWRRCSRLRGLRANP